MNGNNAAGKSNVALIGFMCTGKTSVGRVLSKKLGKRFIEADALIARHALKPIRRIFAEEGEIGFMKHEMDVMKGIARRRNSVVSCGGGIIYNKINIDRLRESSTIVLLVASAPEILKRAKGSGIVRPRLRGKNPEEVQRLIKFRMPLYRAYADIVVSTDGLSVKEVAGRISSRLR